MTPLVSTSADLDLIWGIALSPVRIAETAGGHGILPGAGMKTYTVRKIRQHPSETLDDCENQSMKCIRFHGFLTSTIRNHREAVFTIDHP